MSMQPGQPHAMRIRHLRPGREISVIACLGSTGQQTAGSSVPRSARVRWAALPDRGFPAHGWKLLRLNAAATQSHSVGVYKLPVTTSWSAFEADALARRPPTGTAPWFPVFDEPSLGWLPPLIRLADARTPQTERDPLTTSAAAFFGNTHEEDPELKHRFWPYGDPPPLSYLLANPATEPLLVAFYEQQCVEFLLVLALRFEYALVLGLATVVKLTSHAPVMFEVEAKWTGWEGKARSELTSTNSPCQVGPPKWLLASRGPGSVGHPAFAAWPNWTPPTELAPEDPAGNPLPATATIPRAPAAFSSLSWNGPPESANVISYGPVLWRLERFGFGRASAPLQQAPALPANAPFTQVPHGELLLHSDQAPQFVDYPGMAWPPLEGWYRYRVRSLNLLGAVSTGFAEASLRHYDDIAPPAPRARALLAGGLELAQGATTASVDLAVDWDAAEDFNGPDAAEFRVAAQWVVQQAVSVHVVSATDADRLHADLVVSSLPGTTDQYAGLLLSTPDGDFPIVSNGSGSQASMRVNKAGGMWPEAGDDGYILAGSAPSTLTRVAKLARGAAVAATVGSISATSPSLEFTPTAATATSLPGDAGGRIYLHALQASFDYEQSGGTFTINEPDGGPALVAWERLQSLADPVVALDGSPAIVFPPHELTVDVAVPSGLQAGLLVLSVTAADRASYMASPVLPVADQSLANARGNESTAAEVIVSVRGSDPPQPPQTPAYVPGTITWATSAAAYSEDATYQLGWSAASGAVRYEVWRALEGGVGGAGAATSDADLRSLAASQADAFELRSDLIFSTSYSDSLPGRAPTRALYVVRSVDIAGNRSQPSDLIGPVWVPDVRPPAPPRA